MSDTESLSGHYAKSAELELPLPAELIEVAERVGPFNSLHMAILRPPYLDLILSGTKTIESRFMKHRSAPYGKVAVNDLVLLKHSGGPITGYFFSEWVKNIDLSVTKLEDVEEEYGEGINVQNPLYFWKNNEGKNYCTLIGVGEVGEIPPVKVTKRSPSAWVVFNKVRDGDTLF